MDQGWERIGAVVEMKEQFKGKTCHCCLLSMMRVMMMWRRMTVMMIYLLEHLSVCEGYESSLMIMATATTIIMAMSRWWLSENSHPVHSKHKIPVNTEVGKCYFHYLPCPKMSKFPVTEHFSREREVRFCSEDFVICNAEIHMLTKLH